jgi:adhesin transport system outer membrane protein
MASAKYSKRKELRRAEKEVRVSYAELISARSQSTALRGAVKSKKAVRDIYMKQFEAGTRSFIDILDASHEFFLAKGSLITSDATEDLSAARLLASIGTLIDFAGDTQMLNNDDKTKVDLKIISSKGSQNVKKDSNKEMKGKSKRKCNKLSDFSEIM